MHFQSSILLIVLGDEGDDTSSVLAIRHLAEELETFSLGDSKREGDDEDATAMATNPLEVSSSSSSPDEYSSCASNTIIGGFLLMTLFLKKGFLWVSFDLSFLTIFPP